MDIMPVILIYIGMFYLTQDVTVVNPSGRRFNRLMASLYVHCAFISQKLL